MSKKTKKVKLTNLVNKLNWTEDRKIVNTRSVWVVLKKGRGTKLEKKIGQKTRKWENGKGKSGKKDFESFESFSPSYRICKLSPFKCIQSAKPLRRLHLKCVDRKVKFGQQKTENKPCHSFQKLLSSEIQFVCAIFLKSFTHDM